MNISETYVIAYFRTVSFNTTKLENNDFSQFNENYRTTRWEMKRFRKED